MSRVIAITLDLHSSSIKDPGSKTSCIRMLTMQLLETTRVGAEVSRFRAKDKQDHRLHNPTPPGAKVETSRTDIAAHDIILLWNVNEDVFTTLLGA